MCCCHCSSAKSCPILCDSVNYSTLGFSVLHYLPVFTQIHVHWVGDAKHLILCHRLLFGSLFFFSQHQGLFQWVDSLIRWPNYWSFSNSPSSEYSGLISFRIDWFDLLAVQGTLKSYLLLQWITFCQNSPLWSVHLGWPCTTWFIASLSILRLTYAHTANSS